MAVSMKRKRTSLDPPLPNFSTKVGNGKTLFNGIDGRTSSARRYKEVYTSLLAVITHFARNPTEVEQLLARRAALLAIACEAIENEMAAGKPVDLDSYNTSVNTLRRCMADLNLIETRK